MTYEQWLEYIKTNKDPLYWEHIVTFAPEIANDLRDYKQHIVQRRLNINSGSILSNLKPLILAIASTIKESTND